ncbi:hypothetical protein [Thalassospira xiamenensis]|uniref:hypothetical protein n=1 Tax=Thalassospira xiamenensis TaxID=220697 RepID=UPI0015F06373|nr:hypothetical protein [Thalassospira xiamenensis]
MTNSHDLPNNEQMHSKVVQEEAKRHTVVIGSAVDMWSKLAWDVDVFDNIQRSFPNEKQPLAYAAINVCIAAISLRDWVQAAVKHRAGDEWNKDAFFQDLREAVPELAVCEAIANTSKHSNFRAGAWVGGRVELIWEDGDQDTPSGYLLYHITSDMQSSCIALSRFRDLSHHWWEYLVAHGLTEGRTDVAEWHKNKLKRIFGPIVASHDGFNGPSKEK